MKYKTFNFILKNVTTDDDEKNIGVIEGLASTFGNVDRDGDIIERGAFTDSILAQRKLKQNFPMFVAHKSENLIGGFDPFAMKETDEGLRVIGRVDLDTQKGRESMSLAKKGFLTSMSVGFGNNRDDVTLREGGGLLFKKVNLYEISLTPIPANTQAVITSAKKAQSYKNYPLTNQDVAWDSKKAISQIKAKTGSTDSPSATYRNGFMWFDESAADNFGSYKLPFTFVIDGNFKAVPRALSAIVAVLKGGRGGVDIPSKDVNGVKRNVNGYFSKMGRDLPFPDVGSPKEFDRDKKWFDEQQALNGMDNMLSFLALCELESSVN